MSTATLPNGVFQSKWGFHPCDHATFLKLKRLNWFAHLSRRLNAQYERWARKQPQNRFVKTTKVVDGKKYRGWALDEKGNRIPWLEPVSVPGKLGNDLIAENYRRARFPVSSPEAVKPLTLRIEDIDAELKICETWYADNMSVIR